MEIYHAATSVNVYRCEAITVILFPIPKGISLRERDDACISA